MPPKRKIPKIEENTNVDEETIEKVTASKKAAKNVEVTKEAPSRTLRPRKTRLPAADTKVKSVKIAKKEITSAANNKSKSSAKAKQVSKTEDIEQSDRGEPATKQSKLNMVEEEAENRTQRVHATSIYDFTVKDINGQLVSLTKYKGHVCIIVNVASRCGHTSSNYKEFVELYDIYSENKGLKILAFPCNQFGKQEPGDNEKICEFAKKRNVKFDMFEKIEVNGKNAHPLWKYLTSQKRGPKGEKIDWNFTKFLINKEGQVVERFKPSVKPSALVKELDKVW